MNFTHMSAAVPKMARVGAMLLMTTALLTVSGMSAAQQPPSGGPPNGKPPQEAFDACADKQVGDQCQIKVPNADSLVPGQCVAPPKGGETACLPDDAPKGDKH
ncbi:hypothetical protein [Cobetia sp. L2A1]|uniref:hypothetical protein n=1 Tax=Cobetia sp. L2A1 TaxID=2686360 RepID=UPI00131D146F|nr:hypothetical protein [Cobetia sp. L2A1]